VSVVIPVKDDAPMLAACLTALARQTLDPFEIIVVDNNSTDDSHDVATRAGATTLVEVQPGIVAASKTGYDFASGDIIARVDADTLVSPNWTATLVDAFSANDDVDAFTGGAVFTDGPRPLRRAVAVAYLGAYFVAAALALTHIPVFGSNFAMRRHAWENVRDDIHESERIHDDFDLSFHLGRAHRIRYLATLHAGISMRPLLAGGGVTRWQRGIHTVTLHWPHDLPWLRLARKTLRRG
jgi:glycosyltransferase involved in cell wall biosynthesis